MVMVMVMVRHACVSWMSSGGGKKGGVSISGVKADVGSLHR